MGKDEAVGGPALASQVKVRSGQVEVMSATYQVRKLLFWPARYRSGLALASQVKGRSGKVEVMSGTYQVRKLLFWPARYRSGQVSLGQIRSCYSQPGAGQLWSKSGLVRYKSGHVRSGLALAGLGGRGMEVRL